MIEWKIVGKKIIEVEFINRKNKMYYLEIKFIKARIYFTETPSIYETHIKIYNEINFLDKKQKRH